MGAMEIDPAVELAPNELRAVVLTCLDSGRVSIQTYPSRRMSERHVTTPQIEAALRSGPLGTESCDVGKWRYRAVKRGVVVIFTFDVDEEGNLLVVVTTWRE